MIGTSLGAKLSLAVSHRRLTIGPGSLAPLDDYSSISLVILRRHGTCWWRTTIYWSPGFLATVLGFFYSSCSALSLVYLYHSIRRVGETRSYGSASRFSCDPTVLAFPRGAPSGLLNGLRRWHLLRRFTWLRSKRG